MNTATKREIEKVVEARVKNIALEQGIAEVFDKIGKGNDPALDDLIIKERTMIAEYAKKVIFKKFGRLIK